MQKIDIFEKAIAEKATDLNAYGINRTMFWAYRRSLAVDNELIDFNEVIWDEDIAPIVEAMKALNIHEFTISSTFSSLIPTLAAFDKLGFKVAGFTEVNATYRDILTDECARIPAVRMMSN